MRYKQRPLAFVCCAPEGGAAGSGATPPENGGAGSGATAGGGEPNPEGGAKPEVPLTFDQLLASNREYQSEFDRKINQALTTAKLGAAAGRKSGRGEETGKDDRNRAGTVSA